MKKFVLSAFVFVCGIPFVGQGNAAIISHEATPTVASGDGSIRFGHDGDDVGYFHFAIKAHPQPSGSLLFAAETSHLFPDEVVRVSKITAVTFDGATSEFSGTGALHDTPVSVKVSIFDGKGSDRPDRFSITCTDRQGQVILRAKGNVFVGDLVIGAEKKQLRLGSF